MLDLKSEYLKQICTLADQCFETPVEIWAYGSRVTGESHDTSDLDLVVRGQNLKPVPINELTLFIERLQDSTIPILIQVFDWARIPESFHKNILKSYHILYTPKITAP